MLCGMVPRNGWLGVVILALACGGRFDGDARSSDGVGLGWKRRAHAQLLSGLYGPLEFEVSGDGLTFRNSASELFEFVAE
jgi:hypothetical protein